MHGFTVLFCVLATAACSSQSLLDEFMQEELVSDSRNRGRQLSLRELTLSQESGSVPTTSPTTKPDGKGSCGGVFTENEGTISSPGYPLHLYPSRANCSWRIEVEESKVILMKFKFMDLEVGPPECPFDGVIIMDNLGIWTDAVAPRMHGPVMEGMREPQMPPLSLGRYCGQIRFKPFASVTNGVRVTFYSDGDSEGAGFVLSWKAVDPPGTQSSYVLHGCNFEEGLCPGWENIETEEDSFDWSITSGQTKTESTGPTFDHTENNAAGKYAYVETSAPQLENDTALLSSPQMTFANGKIEYCLEFWYHMFGDAIGSLVVGVASGDNRKIEWMESGNQGNRWLRKLLPIARIEEPFKIMFAGVRGSGYTGDIAIDDIKIYGLSCSDVTEYVIDGSESDGDEESTTAVPPPPQETTDNPLESTAIMETTEDLTTHSATTKPEWMLNVTTFVLETTSDADQEDVDTTAAPTMKTTAAAETTLSEEIAETTIATTEPEEATEFIVVESTEEEATTAEIDDIQTTALIEPQTTADLYQILTTSERHFRTTTIATTTMKTENAVPKTESTTTISTTSSAGTSTLKITSTVALETSPKQRDPVKKETSARPSAKSIMTAIVEGPTMAEKQTGDNDGSSAKTVSSKWILFTSFFGIVLQRFWGRS